MSEITVRTVEIPAGQIEIHEMGVGAPLLFVHGALAGWQLWEPVAASLAARGYRVIMPTLPLGAHRTAMAKGTDLTPPGLARIVVDLVHSLDLDRPTVVSNDTGTAIAQLVLTAHPGVIGRVVLTSGDCFRWFFPPMFRPVQGLGFVPPMLKVVAKLMRRTSLRRSPLAFGWLCRSGIPDDVARDWTETLISDRGVRRDTAAVLRGINTKHTMAAARALPEVDVPVMLVWGELDRAFPIRLARRLAGLIPDCRLETVPGAATFVSMDAPEALAALIESFVPVGGPPVERRASESARHS
jgi:pimeloyl-ACP methyl ester carboxylesterase